MTDRKTVVLVLWGYRLPCTGLGRTLLRTPRSTAELQGSLGWQRQNGTNTGDLPAEPLLVQGPACREHGMPQRPDPILEPLECTEFSGDGWK